MTQEYNETARTQGYPLSIFQQLIFDYQLSKPMSTMYNLNSFAKVLIDIDAEHLAQCAAKAIMKHPAMMTRFFFNDEGELIQKYCPEEVKIEVEYVSEAELIDIREELIQPYSLIDSQLWKFRIFKTGISTYLFYETHHSISDGSSMHILFNDIMTMYAGEDIPEDTYYQFINELMTKRHTDKYHADKAYYQEKYDGIDWSVRPDEDLNETGNVMRELEADIPAVYDLYQPVMRRYAITPTVFFMAVTMLATAEYNKCDKVFHTWTQHGRGSNDSLHIIGTMIQDLPIGIDFSQITTTEALFKEIVAQMKGARRHISYPYTLINNIRHTAANDNLCFLFQGTILDEGSEKRGYMIDLPNHYDATENIFDIEVVSREFGYAVIIKANACRYSDNAIQRYRRLFQQNALRLLEEATKELGTQN